MTLWVGIQLVLITLKLLDRIDWPWWEVLILVELNAVLWGGSLAIHYWLLKHDPSYAIRHYLKQRTGH